MTRSKLEITRKPANSRVAKAQQLVLDPPIYFHRESGLDDSGRRYW